MLDGLNTFHPFEIFTKITPNIESSNSFTLGSEFYNLKDENQSILQKQSNGKLRASLLNFRLRRNALCFNGQKGNRTDSSISISTSEIKLGLFNTSEKNDKLSLKDDFIPFRERARYESSHHLEKRGNQRLLDSDLKLGIESRTPIWGNPSMTRVRSDFFFDELHEETIDLVHFVELTEQEIENRKFIVAQIDAISKHLWPECKVRLFGSFYTGLSLPNGDLDICIMNAKGNKKKKLKLLAGFIEQHSLAVSSSIEIISNARVPIVKFIDFKYLIQIDICFDELSALETSDFIRSKLEEFPHLRPLIIINKIFLYQRQFAETYTGGIGSYLLFTMCLGYLQYIEKLDIRISLDQINLGQLLFYFYQFFGNDYDHNIYGIRANKGSCLFPKYYKHWETGRSTLLTVESPLNNTINLGQNVYKYKTIQRSWRNAWMNLTRYWQGYTVEKGKNSLLLGIINDEHDIFQNRYHKILPKHSADTTGVAAVREKPKLSQSTLKHAYKNIQALVVSSQKVKKSSKKRKSKVQDGKFKFRKYI